MKKYIVTLFVALGAIAAHTANANETPTSSGPKNPFVKWTITPQNVDKETAVALLKAAAQGQEISGAKVIATPANYIEVWGKNLYDFIVNAPSDKFLLGQAGGNEENFGVNLQGKSEFVNILNPGVIGIGVITDAGTFMVAKIGENFCLNPVKDYPEAKEDPDGRPRQIDGNTDTVIKASGAVININIHGGTNTNTNTNTNTTPAGGGGGGYIYDPNARVACIAPPQQPNVVYVKDQQKVPFGQTFGGQVLANAIGSTVGNVAAYYITGQDRKRNTTVVVNQPRQQTRPRQYHQGNYPSHQTYGPGFGWNGNTNTGTVDNTPPTWVPHSGGTYSTNSGATYTGGNGYSSSGTVYTNGGSSGNSGSSGGGFGWRRN